MHAKLFFSRLPESYECLYIDKFLRVLTSGAKSGVSSRRDAESGASMVGRFLKEEKRFNPLRSSVESHSTSGDCFERYTVEKYNDSVNKTDIQSNYFLVEVENRNII